MPRGLPSLVPHPVLLRRSALVAAPLATVLAIGVGITTRDVDPSDAAPPTAAELSAAGAVVGHGLTPRPDTTARDRAFERRALATSRSTERVALVPSTETSGAGRRLWTRAEVDLRIQPEKRTKVAGTVKARTRVRTTGNREGGFAEVIDGSTTRWVTAKYLVKDKPPKPKPKPKPKPTPTPKPAPSSPAAGLVDSSCPGTSGTESGLTSSAVRVYRAVCNAFPAITSYGGYDGHGEHASGRAIDIMVGSTGLGSQIAEFLRAHSGELNLFDVIWAQHIWTPVRSSEGWRSMSDRGSSTANHYDHVHVSVN